MAKHLCIFIIGLFYKSDTYLNIHCNETKFIFGTQKHCMSIVLAAGDAVNQSIFTDREIAVWYLFLLMSH